MNTGTNHTMPGQSKTANASSTQQDKPLSGADLQDSKKDEIYLKGDEAELDLPDVEDIPGQENIVAPPLGALAGTTISSGDEEGEGLLDRDEQDPEEENDIVMGTEADVTKEDIDLLEDGYDYMPTTDEDNLRRSALDNTDNDGDPLNESGFGEDVSGNDLDVPGSEMDDEDEEMGEEDEENNAYSLGGDQHDK